MSTFEILRTALSALRANRGRSALTVLSITVGAFAIVVMSSLAESGLVTLRRGIEEIGGARLLLVVPKEPERGEAKRVAYARGTTSADRDRVYRELPHVEALSMWSHLGKQEIVAESGARATSSVVAADARFFDVFRMRAARGRLFDDADDRRRAPLCVVGHALAAKIGPRDAEPLGAHVSVGPLRCRVVAVLAENGRFGVGFGFDWDDLVVVPTEAMGELDPRVRERAAVLVKTDAPSSNELVKRIVNARLSARRPGLDDFTIFDFAGVMDRFGAVFAAMELVVVLLSAVALFVGGVGVMNMMLVAVTERVSEIGLRKALGARPRAIGAQFLAEAAALSALGGGAGVALGLATALSLSALVRHAVASWQTSLAPGATLSALAVSAGVGLVFGWLPARRAAALDPVHAMRR